MSRVYRDSTTSGDIPIGTPVVKGYVDGNYAWSPADWARHQGSRLVRMAVYASTDDGHELDVESGNATPDQAPGWATMRRRKLSQVTIYCNRATWQQVIDAFNRQGVAAPLWDIADWTGSDHLIPGTVGTQWADDTQLGVHYDQGTCLDYWEGVDPAPTPPPPPPQPAPQFNLEDGDMITMQSSAGIWLLSGDLYVHVPDVPTQSGLIDAGLKQVAISDAMHANLVAGSQALQGKLTGSLAVSGTINAS